MTYKDIQPNAYDPNSQDQQPETKPIDEIIRLAISNALMKTRVMIPGKITEVLGNQKVSVQPLLQTRYTNGDLVNLPVVQNVLVSMPMGTGWYDKAPIAVGDNGTLIFCDRSLDVWSAGSGQIVDPQDSRMHDLSDAIFVPGLVPFSMQTQEAPSDWVRVNGKAKLKLDQDGTFYIGNGTNELIDLMSQLMDTLINETFTLTLLGPQPFIASTNTLLQQIKDKLDTLKES